MALIKCPECGKEISDKAKICIGCGYPIEEFKKNETENIEEKQDCCAYCSSTSFDEEGYCNECGMKRVLLEEIGNTKDNIDELDFFSICPNCNTHNKQGVFKCEKCGHAYKVNEYIVHSNTKKQSDETKSENIVLSNIVEERKFSGIYKYSFLNGKREVHCPRCNSENCSYFQEQRIIPGKTKARYTANLNPLRPFTFANKKEKVIQKERVVSKSKIMCNDCGYIF